MTRSRITRSPPIRRRSSRKPALRWAFPVVDALCAFTTSA
jgi:hypothetical protein